MPRPPRKTRQRAEKKNSSRAEELSRRQKKEVDELSKFIDARGGRLGPFRYGVVNRCTPAESPPPHQ
jgi:hypothetical protein